MCGDFFSKCFDSFFFFNTSGHPELDSGSHFYFFKNSFWFFSFLFLLCFYFFIKIIITSHRKGDYLRVRSPIVLNLIYSQWLYLPVWLRLASPELASTQRCNACALLGVIRCSYTPSSLGRFLRRCLKNPTTSEIEVSSVSYEQIRENH